MKRTIYFHVCVAMLLTMGLTAGRSEAQTSGESESVTATCTDTPCPLGTDLSAEAIVWPAAFYQVDYWLGYSMSPAFFLPADSANGISLKIITGSATAYAGSPGATSLRVLSRMTEGQSYQVYGLAADEWLSVHSDDIFSYEYVLPGEIEPPDPVDPAAEFTTMVSVESKWVCNTIDCSFPVWTGAAVIDWPAWSAYESNGRPGEGSRSVYSMDDVLLYPYMGPWADGCNIRVESGTVHVIEWQRGADVWRTREMGPGETHVIDLVSPEDNALIEGLPGFVVSVSNCEPRPL